MQAIIIKTDNDNQDGTSHDFENDETTKSIDKIDAQTHNRANEIEDDNCIANRTRSKSKSNITTAEIALLADVIIPTTVIEAKSGPYKDHISGRHQ
jgi:hypothetical protein